MAQNDGEAWVQLAGARQSVVTAFRRKRRRGSPSSVLEPVLHSELGDSGEVADVARYQSQVSRENNGCDSEIGLGQTSPLRFQVGAKRSIDLGSRERSSGSGASLGGRHAAS